MDRHREERSQVKTSTNSTISKEKIDSRDIRSSEDDTKSTVYGRAVEYTARGSNSTR